ncbi:hypothetical protein Syun_022170 [Stephania yunnanensis]|uniref:Uncharacterized protein n=1 Tax=Stephania yunnanensis TaxID=152371 RepID=A0AAP0NQB8_9MAGN
MRCRRRRRGQLVMMGAVGGGRQLGYWHSEAWSDLTDVLNAVVVVGNFIKMVVMKRMAESSGVIMLKFLAILETS